jgi:hypothetical protein
MRYSRINTTPPCRLLLLAVRSATLRLGKWHGRGRRFEPDQVHQIPLVQTADTSTPHGPILGDCLVQIFVGTSPDWSGDPELCGRTLESSPTYVDPAKQAGRAGKGGRGQTKNAKRAVVRSGGEYGRSGLDAR